jgi:hypothetical protein
LLFASGTLGPVRIFIVPFSKSMFMKYLILLPFLACICLHVNAQQVPDYSSVEHGTNEQKIARANEAALQAATYLLAMPPDTTNKDVKDAASYMVMWMAETPDYSFELDSAGAQLYGGNSALLSRLLAAMVEYEMKNPADKDDKKKVRLNAARKLIAYAQNPAYKIKMPDGLKKAVAADKKGELDKYLASFDKE